MDENDDKSWVESVSKTPSEVLLFLILHKREMVNKEICNIERVQAKGGNPLNFNLKSKIVGLFREVRSALVDDKNFGEYDHLVSLVHSKNTADLIRASEMIDEWLYAKQVLRFDNVNENKYAFPGEDNEHEVWED